MEKLVVVLDLACVRGYRVRRGEHDGSERLEPLVSHEIGDAHARFGQRVTDQAGRFPGGGPGAMGQGQDHNGQAEIKRRLLREIGDRLNHLLRTEPCDVWYLAASREINHRIVDALDRDARSRLRKNLAADLTKVPMVELLARFSRVEPVVR